MTWRRKRGRREGRVTRNGGDEGKIWKDMVGVGPLCWGREAGGQGGREGGNWGSGRKRTEEAAARVARLP